MECIEFGTQRDKISTPLIEHVSIINYHDTESVHIQ